MFNRVLIILFQDHSTVPFDKKTLTKEAFDVVYVGVQRPFNQCHDHPALAKASAMLHLTGAICAPVDMRTMEADYR